MEGDVLGVYLMEHTGWLGKESLTRGWGSAQSVQRAQDNHLTKTELHPGQPRNPHRARSVIRMTKVKNSMCKGTVAYGTQ